MLARHVDDCALIDQIVTKDARTARALPSDLKGVRFAYAPRHYLDVIEPEVEAHFKDTVRRLREAGAEVVEVDLGDDFSTLAETLTWNLFFRETMAAVSPPPSTRKARSPIATTRASPGSSPAPRLRSTRRLHR